MSDQEAPLSREQVMNRRFELDAAIEEANRLHKITIGPLTEELTMCEQFIKAEMTAGNEQQYKLSSGHQCFFVTKDTATVEDMDAAIDYMLRASPPPAGVTQEAWDGIIRHIEATAMFGLLNKAVNKTACREVVEATKAPVTGVKFTVFKDLSWRRGKA